MDRLFNSNGIKMIALITMTIDHIGLVIFYDMDIFRIIGRIAFPIFAYMIAEGCKFTHSKLIYFSKIFLLGIMCQIVYYFVLGSLYQCILITFSISILIIYAIKWSEKKPFRWVVVIGLVGAAYFLCEMLPEILDGTGYRIDYGFAGVMMPVIISLSDKKTHKVLFSFIGITLVSLYFGGIQWWSYMAMVPIVLYNEKPGSLKLKNFFYIYYPAHLVVIYVVALMIFNYT